MIYDDFNTFNDKQAVTATGVSTDVIDLSEDRNFGIGEPFSVYVQTDVAAKVSAADETYAVELETSSDEAFTSPISIVKRSFTNAEATAELKAGLNPIVLSIAQDERCLRFLRVKHTLAGTSPTWTYSSVLQPTHGVTAEVRGGYKNNSVIT